MASATLSASASSGLTNNSAESSAEHSGASSTALADLRLPFAGANPQDKRKDASASHSAPANSRDVPTRALNILSQASLVLVVILWFLSELCLLGINAILKPV
jgi:hypothetical protein